MEEAAPTLGRWRDEVVIASERGFAAAKDVSFIFIFRETASIPSLHPPAGAARASDSSRNVGFLWDEELLVHEAE